jgi:hypothetical protein
VPYHDRVHATRSWLLLLTVGAALSGCADIVVVNDPISQPNYIMGEERYAARNGSIRVEVGGEMFGLTPETFASRVVDEMRRGYYRHEFFTREASASTDPRYKIVMMFNPDPAVGGRELCAAPQLPSPAPRNRAERTTLLAAFCGGPVALSDVTGWVRLAGVDDPNFTKLVDAVTNHIFPRRDPRMERL